MDGVLDYRLVFSREKINVTASVSQKQVTRAIYGLTSGTKYSFSVFAVFENIQSSGTELTAATGELLHTLGWPIRQRPQAVTDKEILFLRQFL